MIDLHSHILHETDDGATSLEVALDMARWAADDGVEVMACTPHFLPGVYDPDPQQVVRRVAELNDHLLDAGIELALVTGCEAHVRPDLVRRLANGQVLTLHFGKYVLIEMPPSTLPPNMDRLFFDLLAAGYKPIMAHVERYRWADRAMPFIQNLALSGVLMQVTAGSFFGDYGRSAADLSAKLLDMDLVHLVASDAHDVTRRPPGLSKAWAYVQGARGTAEANMIFKRRPEVILLGEAADVETHESAEVL
ncbi:capsular biosynthesis protein [Aestuariivirga litoralis]|uniref:protein-tyrosine-phosphatase n=1 Tax=Aestuariivirga litoralis TaxID=2650924 RepID=A0A2W2BSX4_9HYPH|nr:CpsB/CapC family capsule biosynthesis tyrosine phosphatase [Aestuariivirga litoralis]PZF78777.1 capsular biosynthesis protein [Aestuariivirga litoralis]